MRCRSPRKGNEVRRETGGAESHLTNPARSMGNLAAAAVRPDKEGQLLVCVVRAETPVVTMAVE